MVKKVNAQMKAYWFVLSKPIFIVKFFATFKLVCDANCIEEEAAMWVLPFFFRNALATTFISRRFAAAYITPVVALNNITEPLIQKKLLQLYPEIFNYLLKKFANHQAIAEMDFTNLCYSKLAHMAPMQYFDVLSAKFWKVVDDYDESTINNIVTESVVSSIYHSLW